MTKDPCDSLSFDWHTIDDPNPTSRRTVLASGDEARTFQDRETGMWFAVAGAVGAAHTRSRQDLTDEAAAIAWAEGELLSLVRKKLAAAQADMEVYSALLRPVVSEAHLRSEKTRLITALHDAIRRPLGDVPDSASEWYRQDLADQADARLLAVGSQKGCA